MKICQQFVYFQLQSVAIQRFLSFSINLFKEVAVIDNYLICDQNIVNFQFSIGCDPQIADSVYHFLQHTIKCFLQFNVVD